MYRLAVVVAIGVAACGQTTDDRPPTLENITETILAPSCGGGVCHSSYRRQQGYTFDTVDAVRQTINNNGLVAPGDPEGSFLVQVMTRTIKRMPYDAPLPDADILLIKEWITMGAPGL